MAFFLRGGSGVAGSYDLLGTFMCRFGFRLNGLVFEFARRAAFLAQSKSTPRKDWARGRSRAS